MNGFHPHVGLVPLHGGIKPRFCGGAANRLVLVMRFTVLHEVQNGARHQRIIAFFLFALFALFALFGFGKLRLQEVALVQVRGFHLQLHLDPVLLFRNARDVAVHDVLNLQHASFKVTLISMLTDLNRKIRYLSIF